MATTLVVAGCELTSRGPTNVAQGLRYSADEPEFDAFFRELFEIQLLLGRAPARDEKIRRALAEKFEVSPPLTTGRLGDAVLTETRRLARDGIALRLVVSGRNAQDEEPVVALETIGPIREGSDHELVAAIDAAARGAAALLNDMRAGAAAIGRLQVRATDLSNKAHAVFEDAGQAKQRTVAANLADSLRLMPLMARRADTLASSEGALLDELSRACNGVPLELPDPEASPDDAGASRPAEALPKEPSAQPQPTDEPPFRSDDDFDP